MSVHFETAYNSTKTEHEFSCPLRQAQPSWGNLPTFGSHHTRHCANVCKHPHHEFVCAGVGNEAIRVTDLPTGGGAVAWYLHHQRCDSTGLLFCAYANCVRLHAAAAVGAIEVSLQVVVKAMVVFVSDMCRTQLVGCDGDLFVCLQCSCRCRQLCTRNIVAAVR
nr:hypothetical transcript [Hymenolepis microstoma]CDS25722.1 hypothetical protein HmN_000616000 [Hymenolepis microstoma]